MWLKSRTLTPVGLAYGNTRITELSLDAITGTGTHISWAAAPPSNRWLTETFERPTEVPAARIQAAAPHLTNPDLLQQLYDTGSIRRQHAALMSPASPTPLLTEGLNTLFRRSPSATSTNGHTWAAATTTLAHRQHPTGLYDTITEAPTPALGRKIAQLAWYRHRTELTADLNRLLATQTSAAGRRALLADLILADLRTNRPTDWLFGPTPHPHTTDDDVHYVWHNKIAKYNDTTIRWWWGRQNDDVPDTIGTVLTRNTNGQLTFDLNQLAQLPLRAVLQGRTRATGLLHTAFARLLQNLFNDQDAAEAWQITISLFEEHNLHQNGRIADTAAAIHTALAA